MSENAAPQRKSGRNRMVIGAGLAVIVIVVAIIVVASAGNSGVSVSQARLDKDPVLGNPEAPVTLVEYGAYSCPSCRALYQSGVIQQLITDTDGRVKLIFRDFPIVTPNYDHMAAEIAQCVFDQGNDLFWHFHDALYTQVTPSSRVTSDVLINLAVELGANEAPLRQCYDSGINKEVVTYDENRARALGLRGTPGLFINDSPVFSFNLDDLRAMVQQALANS